MMCPATPHTQRRQAITRIWFRLFPVRSPLLGKSRLLSFPPGTKMFQFPGYGSSYPILFRYGYCSMTHSRFPHSGIHGSKPACGSPWLFVARYALLRPLAPRHPPYALYNLTFWVRLLKNGAFLCCCVNPASSTYIIYACGAGTPRASHCLFLNSLQKYAYLKTTPACEIVVNYFTTLILYSLCSFQRTVAIYLKSSASPGSSPIY